MLPPNTVFAQCFDNIQTTVFYKVIGEVRFNGKSKEILDVVGEFKWAALIDEKVLDNQENVCDN